jgi:hypothetical protein
MHAMADPIRPCGLSFAAVLGRTPRFRTVIATDAHKGPVYVALEAS